MLKNRRVIDYNPKGRSRSGVFPRYRPQDIRWFETDPCCIFHTAMADGGDEVGVGQRALLSTDICSLKLLVGHCTQEPRFVPRRIEGGRL